GVDGRGRPASPGRIDRPVGSDGRSDRQAAARAGDGDAAPPAADRSGTSCASLVADGVSDGGLHLPRAVDRAPRPGHHPDPEVTSLEIAAGTDVPSADQPLSSATLGGVWKVACMVTAGMNPA